MLTTFEEFKEEFDTLMQEMSKEEFISFFSERGYVNNKMDNKDHVCGQCKDYDDILQVCIREGVVMSTGVENTNKSCEHFKILDIGIVQYFKCMHCHMEFITREDAEGHIKEDCLEYNG